MKDGLQRIACAQSVTVVGGHSQQMQIVITKDGDDAIAECAHEAQGA